MDSHPIQTRNILANMEDLGWEKLWMWNFSFVDRSTPDSFVICWAWLLIIFECRETAWHVALLELCPTTCNLPKTKPGSAYWTQQFSWKPWCWTRLTVLPPENPSGFSGTLNNTEIRFAHCDRRSPGSGNSSAWNPRNWWENCYDNGMTEMSYFLR